jgi:hypothetical protein
LLLLLWLLQGCRSGNRSARAAGLLEQVRVLLLLLPFAMWLCHCGMLGLVTLYRICQVLTT